MAFLFDLLLYFGVEWIRGIRGAKLPTIHWLCGLWSALCATAARNMSTSIWRVGLLVQQKLASLIFSPVKVHWVQQTVGISISPSLISNLRGNVAAHRTFTASPFWLMFFEWNWEGNERQGRCSGMLRGSWSDGYKFNPPVINQGGLSIL